VRYIHTYGFFLLLTVLIISAKGDRFKADPPGTVKLTDTLFLDRYPVKVKDYLEFLKSIRYFYSEACHDSLQKLPKFGLNNTDVQGLMEHFTGDSLLYEKMLTRSWVTYSNHDRRYDVDFRLKSARFYDYPIVNIDYDQMRYYCQWRTDMVMLHYATSCKTEKKRRNYPMNFKYRMVKRKEWELAIAKFFKDIKKDKNKKGLSTRPNNVVKPYFREKRRDFYYDVDNAAETLDKAIVTFNFKWNESIKYGNISYFKLEEPSDWISFRCICEVLPEENQTAN
jgi:hypothetical protein